MSVRMLAEKAGQLQGMGPDTIARQVYGLGALYRADQDVDPVWPGYAGAIVSETAPGTFDVLDYVLEVHEV